MADLSTLRSDMLLCLSSSHVPSQAIAMETLASIWMYVGGGNVLYSSCAVSCGESEVKVFIVLHSEVTVGSIWQTHSCLSSTTFR